MATKARARAIEPGILGATDVPGQPWDKPFGDVPGLPLHRPKPQPATEGTTGGEAAGEGEAGEAGGTSSGGRSEVMEKARRENRALEEATSTEADRRGESARERGV